MKSRCVRILFAISMVAGCTVRSFGPEASARTLEPLPFGTTACPGIAPGSLLITPNGGTGTLNFVFKGSDGRRYIGTAGHTAVQAGERSTWKGDQGPPAVDGAMRQFGRYVLAVLDPEVKLDFALIRLDRGVDFSPALCHFGGPVGVNSEVTNGMEPIHYYGNGVVWGSSLPARTGVAERGFYGPRFFYATGPGNFGDSGSPVIDDQGRAVGIIVAVGPIGDVGGTDDLGEMAVFRLGPQLEVAQDLLSISLTLERASRGQGA